MVEADLLPDPELVDRFVQVVEDRRAVGDRLRVAPRLEFEAQRVRWLINWLIVFTALVSTKDWGSMFRKPDFSFEIVWTKYISSPEISSFTRSKPFMLT